jgi:tRNA pseudouridine38-40 synthase
MQRYFLEVAYKGTNYSGFQRQENANTVQAEIEKAFHTLHRQPVYLTGSSRTDAGVHALQNYFHFDFEPEVHPQFTYKMNAILPTDIVIKELYRMPPNAHARFDATSREYEYRIYRSKNPFLQETAFYYPYKLNMDLIEQAAEIIKKETNFFAFSKTNTQVNNYNCTISKSRWICKDDLLIYNIEANRFLRGMVRLVTASILKTGRGALSLRQLQSLFHTNNKCGYSVPAHGLFLKSVNYPQHYFAGDHKHP